MTRNTILLGIFLIILGVAAYFMTGRASVTAMIPAFVGAPIALLGFIATNEKLRKHMIHLALVLALLGAVAGFMQSAKAMGDPEKAATLYTCLLMAVPCLLYVVLGVRSFIAARKARTAAGE
ncbi:MAG: hypothetical protein AAF514_03920 [Verrucomicrobiota bacterium]